MNSTSFQNEYTGSRALIVGINDYAQLNPLRGSVNDATAVATILKSEFRFPEDQVILLLDQDATQRAIFDHLELISQRSQPDDRIIFFFAGHGITRRDAFRNEIGHIACVESQDGDWNSFIRFEDVTRFSNLIAAKHIFYVFDACFSGLALSRRADVSTRAPIEPQWLNSCMTHRTRQVLTAGLVEEEVADLIEEGHSIFTSYFLRALAGEAEGSQGEITASRVMGFVADRVMKDSRSEQKPAYGELHGSEPGGDFVFKFPALSFFRVPADREGGINTGILVRRGQNLSISASGVITYDSGYHFTNPDGVLCTYKGQPLAHAQALIPMIVMLDTAYRTDNGENGIIGSLIGWIAEYSEERAFKIGQNREITAINEGYLYLAVNDARGTYGDNQGEYEVTVRIV